MELNSDDTSEGGSERSELVSMTVAIVERRWINGDVEGEPREVANLATTLWNSLRDKQ